MLSNIATIMLANRFTSFHSPTISIKLYISTTILEFRRDKNTTLTNRETIRVLLLFV